MSANNASELIGVITGYLLPRCVHVAAELGIADLLDDTPQSVETIAQAAHLQVDSLNRILRLLASHGIFKQVSGGYDHTDLSRQLRSDHPQSLRPYARMVGSPLFWQCFGELQHAVVTGEPAMNKLDARGIFGYFKDHPDEGYIFNAAMEAKAQRDIQAVTEVYDFSAFRSIADIGGGRGHLLKAILAKSQTSTGVLFDQPHVLEEAVPTERLSLHPGDFFAGHLPKCEAYVLMEVLHDWNDQQCQQILASLRDAAPRGATLLVIETIMSEGFDAHFSQILDVIMLVVTGGRERTKDQYEKLLDRNGFRLTRVIGTSSPCSIVEAVFG
ncbi:MAG: acetylserotonin O-methyltransferase [Acidobacteriota bacterium]|nr:acetylserotonin O-methyltransferase [Acidobacteriota bacterium]